MKFRRRVLCVLLPIVTYGCAFTDWNREQDLVAQIHELNSGELAVAIQQAREP